jgi:hypothetical protein
MQSLTRTGEFEPAAGSAPADVETADEAVTAELRPASMVTAVRSDQCPACSTAMASDQRYCLECGERRGPARVPLLDSSSQRARARETPAAHRPPARARASVNSTLIAGIGTLLLAMGVGVLIGRSANSTSAKAPPAQVVTVAGGGGTAGTAAASTAAQTPPAGAAKAPTASGASATPARSASKAPSAAPPKAVKVGSPGKGPGYQHGHFTGNFFGPESE